MSLLAPLVPLFAAGLSFFGMREMMKGQTRQQQAMLQQIQGLNQNALGQIPELPKAPVDPDSGVSQEDIEANEAERERKAQLEAMAKQNALVNPTGGLGISGLPSIRKRSALGGI